MTAATTTMKVPLSPLAIIMFTLAAVSAIVAVIIGVIGSVNDWPPQPLTLNAAATIGLWAAGFHYRAHPPATGETFEDQPPLEPEEVDEVAAGLAALDLIELDRLEQKLRETDEW